MGLLHVIKGIRCYYCNKNNIPDKWPEYGSLAAMYFQKEPENYYVEMYCPYCNKTWYIVWDDNPGIITPLSLMEKKIVIDYLITTLSREDRSVGQDYG